MFLDGVTYATISRNLSIGLGTWFKPFYTESLYSTFYEHPPFFFIIQSFFYSILGDRLWVEKLFSIIMFLISSFLINLIWQNIFFQEKRKVSSFLPSFFWLITPLVFWSFTNNLIENLLVNFLLASYYFYFKKNGLVFSNTILSAFFVFMAFFTKGPVGLFPLIFPIADFIQSKFNFKKVSLFYSSIFLFALLAIIPEPLRDNLRNYFDIQLLPSISNAREVTTSNRFSILFRLFLELTLPIIFLLTLVFKSSFKLKLNKNSISFIFIAICASLPLIITLKQRPYYLVPAIPFYILGISLIIYNNYYLINFQKIPSRLKEIIFYCAICIFLTSLSLMIFNNNKISRDKKLIFETKQIAKITGDNKIISISENLFSKWSLHAYLYRNHFISLDQSNKLNFYLVESSNNNLQGYNKVYSGEIISLLEKEP